MVPLWAKNIKKVRGGKGKGVWGEAKYFPWKESKVDLWARRALA